MVAIWIRLEQALKLYNCLGISLLLEGNPSDQKQGIVGQSALGMCTNKLAEDRHS